jgi:hypothetical protein
MADKHAGQCRIDQQVVVMTIVRMLHFLGLLSLPVGAK